MLTVQRMNAPMHTPIAVGRRFGAWVCLAALVLVWAPMWAAAWDAATSMACCSGGSCPAHGRSKSNQPGPEKSSPAEAPMNCEHHAGNGMTDCVMSCSHESASSPVTAAIFVLPEPATISRPAEVTAARANVSQMEFAHLFEP